MVFEVQLGCLHASLYTVAIEVALHKDAPSRQISEQKFCSIASSLMHVFEKVEAYKDAKAKEEAQLFKTKLQTVRLETDEEKEEASYKALFPDHTQDFADLEDLELDEMPVASQPMATESQAQSSQSQSLMDGSFLQDIVHLHRSVFGEDETINYDLAFRERYQVGQTLLQILDRIVQRGFDDVTLAGGKLNTHFNAEILAL